MKKTGRSWKERICALLLAAAMIVTWMLPDMAMTSQAAPGDPVDVYFSVWDVDNNNAPLTEDVVIEVYKGNSASGEPVATVETAETDPAHENMFKVSGLEEGETYTYEVEKTGYEYHTKNQLESQRNFTASAGPVNVSMQISEIEIEKSEVSLKVGDAETIEITNWVVDGDYTWTVINGSQYVKVEEVGKGGKITATAAGNIGDDTEKEATVKVILGEKIKYINVKINKQTLDNLSLSAKEPSGNDQTQVILTATGIPNDAGGTLNFQVDGKSCGQSPAKEGASVTYTDSKNIIAKKQFSVIYSGDTKYASKTVGTEGNYTKTQKLVIEGQTPNAVTYGALEWDKEISVSLDESTIKDRKISVSADFVNPDEYSDGVTPEQIADIKVEDNKTIKIKPKNAGEIKIIITAEGNESYIEDETSFIFTVNRQEISLTDIAWDKDLSKIYDGSKGFQISGTVKGTSDRIVIDSAKVQMDDPDVAKDENSGNLVKKDVTVEQGGYQSTNESGPANYLLKVSEDNRVSGIATVTYRPLYVTAKDCEVKTFEYGQNIKDAVENTEGLIKLENNNGAIVQDENSGLISGESVSTLPGATVDSAEEFVRLQVQEEAFNIIKPDITEQNKYCGNYEFKFDDTTNNRGSLKVAQQTIAKDQLLRCIELSGITSGIYGVTEADSNDSVLREIYVSADGKDEFGADKYENDSPVLKLRIKDSENFKASDYYDTVFISIDNQIIDATQAGVSSSVLEYALDALTDKEVDKKAIEKVQVYLGRSDSEATKTNQVNLDDWLYIDNKAPVANILNFTPTVYSKMADALSFGLFTNKIYTATVVVSDEGSGLSDDKPQQYYVWELGSDIEEENLSKAAIKAQIQTITEKGQWNNLDESGTFKVGEGENKEIVENNYIIFIKTIDNADNCSVYVSNGMVIDISQPTINCTFAPATATQDGIDNYQGDAEYEITIEDPESYFSGIKSVQVDVYVNGNKVDSGAEIKELDEEALAKTYENSFSIQLDGERSYTQLKKESDFTIKAVVPARNVERDLNNVKVKITAEDKAGNISEIYEKQLVIDNISPQIEVSYNDDTNTAHNDIYFNNKVENRIMTISYKERNMNVGDATDPYPDVLFNVKVDGQSAEGVHLNQLADYGITWVDEEVKDYIGNTPTSEFDVTEYTEERTCTLQLEFAKDGEYTVIPYCKDILENESGEINYTNENSKANESFIIDTTDPVVTVIYSVDDAAEVADDIENASDEESRVYTNHFVHAKIEINEKNFSYEKEFAEGQSDFSGTAGTDAPEGTEDFSKFESRTNWSYNVGLGTTTLDFEADANYTFEFTYTDLAGNSYTYNPHYFTVDQTAPTGKIEVNGSDSSGIVKDLIRTISFGFFFNDDTEIKFSSEDFTSVYKQQYYMYNPGDIHGEIDQLDIIGNDASDMTLDNIKIEDWIGTDNYSRTNEAVIYYTKANTQQVPYMRLEDKAGNVSFITTDGVIDDRQSPDNSPKITITTANPAHGIYNRNVDFRIQVTDPKVNGTYAGLKEVSYVVLKDGEVTQSGNYNAELADGTQRKQSIVKTETVDAEKNNSNTVQIKVTATDWSGNTATETKDISIDITKPEITVEYDLNSPLNERYYNATRTATVTVTERNFDPSAVRFSITNTDGTQPSISGWTHSSDSGVSDDATHTCYVTFAADGDYTFTLNTTDLAGNDSNYTRVDDFTIDQTDPTIQVTYDNNNDAEPGYFNADRTATITINEHNFNAADVNIAITASLEGRGVAIPGLSGWSTRGDVHTASVTFSADADYTFDVDYTDLAGNAAADYEQDSFTVDQTAPELEFFDIEDKSANNDVVAPGVRYSDNNYTENGVELTLTGANNGSMDIDGKHSSIPNGESIKMADFERVKDNDDLYTMTAVITDRAGNETEKSVIFSVNRFGSVYIIGDATKEWLKTGENEHTYINEEQDVHVTEINVDSIVASDISYGRDGQIKKLEAGKDYEVKGSGSEVSWKQYDYTINKENFGTEGNYTVAIDSEDRATNVGNSRVKGCNIEFTVDKTAPTLVITGIEDSGSYRADTRDVTIDVVDNYAMDNVVVSSSIGGEEQEYSLDQIQEAGGKLVYTMQSANSDQDLKAVATDAAGNTAEAETVSVLLTSNLLIQYINNTPLLVGSIAAVVVIAGGLLWFFLVFKRRKEEQANK